MLGLVTAASAAETEAAAAQTATAGPLESKHPGTRNGMSVLVEESQPILR